MSHLLCDPRFLDRACRIAATDYSRCAGLSQQLRESKGPFGKLRHLKNTHRTIPNDELGSVQGLLIKLKCFRTNIHHAPAHGNFIYVNNLSADELGRIRYDLDADVTATPNYDIGVLDPAAVDFFGRTVSTQFPPQVYEPSKVARNQLIKYYDSIGKNHILFSPVGTDAFSFNIAGIPASGVLTGQDCCKTQPEVDLFGGFLGNYEGNVPSFDGGCVDNPFRWCDNLGNNDKNVLTFVSKAFADSTVRMAFNKSVMWAGENAGPNQANVKLGAKGPHGTTHR